MSALPTDAFEARPSIAAGVSPARPKKGYCFKNGWLRFFYNVGKFTPGTKADGYFE